MNILYFLSDCMIPLVIVLVVAYGMLKKVDVFDEFIEGAKDGFLTVYKIMPTLIGLMIGVGILRESLAMDYLAAILAPVVKLLHFPGELLPLFIVKMFSFVGGYRTFAGYLQNLRNGLLSGNAVVGPYELFRDNLLYNECVFHDGQSDQNQVHTGRGFVCYHCGSDCLGPFSGCAVKIIFS